MSVSASMVAVIIVFINRRHSIHDAGERGKNTRKKQSKYCLFFRSFSTISCQRMPLWLLFISTVSHFSLTRCFSIVSFHFILLHFIFRVCHSISVFRWCTMLIFLLLIIGVVVLLLFPFSLCFCIRVVIKWYFQL